jgi:hypothetical protein
MRFSTSIVALTILGTIAVSLPVHLLAQDDQPRKTSNKKNPSLVKAEKAEILRKPQSPRSRSHRSEPMKGSRTWLGIMTASVHDSLRDHLEIEGGVGIQIHQVVDDSPATKAGLQNHDILIQFNDQILISPEHLSILVRREKPGTKAELTLIRAGNMATVNVTLGESENVSPNPFPRPGRMVHPTPQAVEIEGIHRNRRENRHPMPPQGQSETPVTSANPNLSIEIKPPAVSVKPGFPVNIMSFHGVVKIDNGYGDVTITRTDEEHAIKINDADGKSIYDGPYDSAKGTEGLPKLAREHLRKMKLDDLKLLTRGSRKPSMSIPAKEKKAPVEEAGTPL